MKKFQLLKPDLILISDKLYAWEKEGLLHLKKMQSQTRIIFLPRQKIESQLLNALSEAGIIILSEPINTASLSKEIYIFQNRSRDRIQDTVFAVWTPKAGDGGSFTAVHLAETLRNVGGNEKIGLLDFDIKSDSLKYQLGLDSACLIDELLPYIAAGKLSAPLMLECAREVIKKGSNIWFVGGISQPGMYARYSFLQLHFIIKTAKSLFAKTIIDAGSLLDNAGTICALKEADVILAVLNPSYVSKQMLQRSLEKFPLMGINPGKVKIIINRFSPEIIGQNPKVIVEGLDIDLVGLLPDLGLEGFVAVNGNRTICGEKKKALLNYNTAMNDMLSKLEIIPKTKLERRL